MWERVLSVVNVPSSTMARARQIVLPTLAGPEVCVASTKAFTCQLATLACLAVAAGRDRGMLSADDEVPLVRALADVPSYMTCALELEPKIRQLARKIAPSRNALFIGRGTNYPLALEGALKGNNLHSRRGLCRRRTQARADRAHRQKSRRRRDRAG